MTETPPVAGGAATDAPCSEGDRVGRFPQRMRGIPASACRRPPGDKGFSPAGNTQPHGGGGPVYGT